MRRPTERPLPGVVELTDAEAPDFIESHRVALLAFLDFADERAVQLRGRLNLLAARHMRADDPRTLGIGILDVAAHPHVAEALGVRRVPELILFVEGEVQDRLTGPAPERVLDEMIALRLADAK